MRIAFLPLAILLLLSPAAPAEEPATARAEEPATARAEEPATARAEEPAVGRLLEFEVTLLHVRSMEPLSPEERALDGRGVLAALPGWRKAGRLERLTTFRTRAFENQAALVQVGVEQSVPSAQVQGPGRGTQTVYSRVQLGSMLNITGTVDEKGRIVAELKLEETRLEPAEPPAGGEEGGRLPGPGEQQSFVVRTTVAGASGECLVVGGTRSERGGEFSESLLLLTPRVLGAPR